MTSLNKAAAEIVLNRIQTPDGTILTSTHRHDFKTYTDANGQTYMVDGGLDYLRRNVVAPPHQYKELSVYDDAPFEIIRESFEWGTFGKDGKQPIRKIKLCEMSDAHIDAILNHRTTMMSLKPKYQDLFKREIGYRIDNNIVVEDE